MGEPVTLKLRLDADEANRVIQQLDGSFNKAARSAGVAAGGQVNNLAGQAKNVFSQIGIGRMGLFATAAAFAGPAIADAGSIANGRFFGPLGREFSRAMGLRGESAEVRAIQAARDRTAQVFGIAADRAPQAQLEAAFNSFLDMEQMRARGAQRIEKIADVNAAQPLLESIERLNQSIRALTDSLGGKVLRLF